MWRQETSDVAHGVEHELEDGVDYIDIDEEDEAEEEGEGGLRDPTQSDRSAISQTTADGLEATACESRSLLKAYFSCLCRYHGADRVDATILALLTSLKDSFEAASSLQCSSCELVDFTSSFIGRRHLLAFADLVRVTRLEVKKVDIDDATKSEDDSGDENDTSSHGGPVKVVFHRITTAPFATPSLSTAPTCVMATLFPHLRVLRLNGLALNFSISEEMRCSRAGVELPQGGNEVLRYLLSALQGHPALAELHLCQNPIAAALLPSISHLLRQTPSLVLVDVTSTLLTEAEVAVIAAQCRLNELRLARDASLNAGRDAAAQSEPATPARSKVWKAALQLWLQQKEEEVRRVVQGLSSVDLGFGRETCYVQRVLHFCDVRNPGNSSTAYESLAGAARQALPQESGQPTAAASSHASGSFLSYYARGAAEGRRETWSRECTDVIRCAFTDPVDAQFSILGGRPTWTNLPGPLGPPEDAIDRTAGLNASRPTEADLSSTDLLLALHRQLLPLPPKPRSIFRDGAIATLQTTAEETYAAVCRDQSVQWKWLLKRLQMHLVPIPVVAGQVLYDIGDITEFMYFLPKDTGTTVRSVQLAASRDSTTFNRVLPGQWFGEAEVLGSLSRYTAEGAKQTAVKTDYQQGNQGESIQYISAPVLHVRASTARLCSEGPHASDPFVVWGLPLRVAFFYLYEPFQQHHSQFLARTPMNAFSSISPILLSTMVCHLLTTTVDSSTLFHPRKAAMKSTTASGASAPATSAVICSQDVLSTNIVLLQEGEYRLRLPRQRGSHAEHHLLSGNTLLLRSLYDRCTKCSSIVNERRSSSSSSGGGVGGNIANSVVVGKEMFIREYWESKRAADASATLMTTSSAAGCSRREALDVDAAASEASQEEVAESEAARVGQVELCVYPLAQRTRWRYALLRNEEFAALAPELCAALTRHAMTFAVE